MTLYRLGYITSYKSGYKKLQKRELELILERHAVKYRKISETRNYETV
jgi:hypothetical protein